MYHFSAQVISRKAGRSATAAAAYRAGEEVTDHRTGEVHDYTRKGGVVGASILAPADAPAWVFDREQLWNQVESAERRKDAQLCREIDAAIPVELDEHQRIEAVRQFVEAEMVSRGMVADVAFHDFDNDNPHCHIMLSMRDLEPDGFGKKNRDWNDRSVLNGWREKWAEHMNKALELAGEEKRIDHRSYADQGLDYEPTWHMGPAVAAMERRKPGSTRIGQENQERKERNLVHDLLAQDIDEGQIYVDRVETELDALGDEREKLEVEIELKQEREAREAREAEIERQLAAEREREAERQAAEDAAAQAAADRELEQLQANQKAEAAARRERALERLQSVVPDHIRRTLGFMKEHGIEPPESVQKALEARGYIDPPEKPEKPPMTALEREFLESQPTDDHEDDFEGPGLG